MERQSKYVYALIEECIEKLSSTDCHAVFEHEYKDDEQLKTRCRYEKIKGASCFNKGTDIVKIIEDALWDEIMIFKWLKSDTNGELRIVRPYKKCGKKFVNSGTHNWDDGPLTCNHVVMVFGKELDFAGCPIRLFVKTCYPM